LYLFYSVTKDTTYYCKTINYRKSKVNNDLILWLQNWYHSNCNGDWEHQFGIKIDTLDNPGWSIDINIEETNLQNILFEPIKIKRSEKDWVFIELANMKIQGRCGSLNLIEMLEIFQNWVVSNQQ
jgi:hypothetical protein